MSSARLHEYSIVSHFTHGYRAREDVTTLPPGVLIEGSQNVLTNTFQRVGVRKGYTLDGAANTDDAPIGGNGTAMGTFDWVTSSGQERNMRAGFLTSAGNDGKLQFRHVKSTGEVEWLDILTGLTSVNFNFVTFFDSTQLKTVLLMVNGESNIRVWGGGAISLASGANPTGIVGLFAQPGGDTNGRVSGGKNFTVGDVLSLSGGGNNAQITVTAVTTPSSPDSQSIDTATVDSGGSNYAVNDLFSIDAGVGGGEEALCKVLTLSGSAIASFSILNPGSADYTVSSGNATTAVSGVGTGATINIGALAAGNIVSWAFASDANHGTGYSATTTYTLTGGSGTLAYIYLYSAVTGSITKSGTETWAQAGFTFQVSGTYSFVANGTTYTYDSSDFLGDTTTLYGVTPDPSSIASGDLAVQDVTTITNAGGSSGLPTTFANQLIGVLVGHIFVGSLSESYVYISNINSYTVWSPSTTFLSINNPPTAFAAQDEQLYISAGTSQWFQAKINYSADLTSAAFSINPTNTAPLQGAQSQALTTKIQNSIAFVSFEPAVQSFGPVENIFLGPQMVDFSYSIVNLMNNYDFTGGSIAYYRKFVYIAVPTEGVVLVYNMTDPKNLYWEAPQRLPIGRFSIIGGELYGHSSQVSETYKLFTGYADRVTPTSAGTPITADWVFSYENYGSRFSLKRATKMYVEGYINSETTLAAAITYEMDGCAVVKNFSLEGDDNQFVCIETASTSQGSIGKSSLGKEKLGGNDSASAVLPPKFRWFPTFSNTDFFENSISFSSTGLDNRVDILAFGLAVGESTQIPVQNYD